MCLFPWPSQRIDHFFFLTFFLFSGALCFLFIFVLSPSLLASSLFVFLSLVLWDEGCSGLRPFLHSKAGISTYEFSLLGLLYLQVTHLYTLEISLSSSLKYISCIFFIWPVGYLVVCYLASKCFGVSGICHFDF